MCLAAQRVEIEKDQEEVPEVIWWLKHMQCYCTYWRKSESVSKVSASVCVHARVFGWMTICVGDTQREQNVLVFTLCEHCKEYTKNNSILTSISY